MGYLLCPLCCGRSFSNRKSLHYHLLASKSNISCPECNQRFDTIVELADHLERETCEQQAVVISVTAEHVNEVGAGSDSAKSKRKRPTSVEKFHQDPSRTMAFKEEVVNSPESTTEEKDTWIVGEDGIPMDVSANYEIVMSDALNVSHDSDAIQQWEQEVPDEETEHYCNSCNCKVYGVLEHINKFHAAEMVILQNAEVVDTEVVETEFGMEDEDDEEVGHPCESLTSALEISPTAASATHGPVTATTSSTVSKTKVHDPVSNIASRKNKAKVRLPKVYGTVDESNMIDAKTGIPYVRRIVHIEKFWENESFKLSSKDNAAESDSSLNEVVNVQPGGRRKVVRVADVAIPNKNQTLERKQGVVKATRVSPLVVKVPPKRKKPTLVQAHIGQLLRSRAIDSLKQSWEDTYSSVQSNDDILQRLLTAANDEADRESNEVSGEGMNASSNSPTNSLLIVKDEDRSTIIKFVADSEDTLGENTIPVFFCNVCSAEFSDPHQFAAHKCKIPKTVLPTLCDVCGMKCKSNRGLRTHMESHDPKSKAKKLFNKQVQKLLSEPATCDICNTEFTTAGGLKVHKRMHRPDNVQKVAEMNNKVEYRCDLCNMVCYSERTFRIHYKVHITCQQESEFERETPPVDRPNNTSCEQDMLTCKLCNVSFSSNEDLKVHWQTHYPAGVKSTAVAAEETVVSEHFEDEDGESFTCRHCGKRLAENLRDIHEKMHRGELQFGCSVCNKHFSSEVNLEFHMTTHRTELELECLTCKTKFTDPALLKLHRKTHAGTDRPYPCGFCGRRFSRPHEKVKHERIHTGEKPYECAICGMRFRVGYCLKMHERIHTGVRPYSCEHCGKTFRARSGYKQHIRLHSDVRAFVCPFCPKTFKTVVQLAGHKKSHTKPYSCPHCGRRFATMYMVRAHVNTHAKSSLKHCCYICGASYGRDYALKDHIKTHGKNVPPPPDNEEEDAAEIELASDISNDTNNS